MDRELNIVVRTGQLGDFDGIMRARRFAMLSAYPNDMAGITQADIITKLDLENADHMRKEYSKWLDINSSQLHSFVAIDRHDLAGYVFVQKFSNESEIQAINVHPKYFGKAVAQKLIDEALEWLGRSEPVFLTVVKHNLRAIRFYEKNGFQIDPHSKVNTEILPTGKIMPEWRMVKKETNS